ncbi:MAG: hypothetical protein K6E91_02605 [Butyrivibrio sp.]|nr:hypothetical protein [Butyrivibrio sp.]
MKHGRMKLVSALAAITLLFIIPSCGSPGTVADDVKSDEEPSQEKAAPQAAGTSASEDMQQPSSELSEDELEEFTVLFNIPEYNGFLSESFSSPEKINWDAVMQFGAGISARDIGEEEVNDYLKAVRQDKVYGELLAVRRADLGEYITKHTGLDSVPDDALSWEYIADHDSYYTEQPSSEPVSYTCVEGTRKGDDYELRFRVNQGDASESKSGKNYGRRADRVLTLRMVCGEAIVESNAIQWDDYCDESQTFDVSFPQFDSTVRFITYSVAPDDISIVLVKDGNRLTDLFTSVQTEEGSSNLNEVLAVSFFDFDYDGMVDIEVIGDSKLGKHALLYKAVSTEYLFESFADLDEKKMTEIGSDFTLPGIREAILGDSSDDVQMGYQDLYARIARLYQLTNDEYKFDLINVDDNSAPALVIDCNGYHMSLYSCENGKSHCLMYNRPYGAAGNAGYSYAPGKGVFFNQNSDHAGAIMNVYYMLMHEGKELEADYAVTYLMFNDLNKDGSPSDDEIAATEDFHPYSAKYYNYTDKNMTDAETEAKIKLLDGYDQEYISGKLDYKTLINRLRK